MAIPVQAASLFLLSIPFLLLLSAFIFFFRIFSDPATTIGRFAVTPLGLPSIALVLVIKGDFFSSFEAFADKKADTKVSIHRPLLCFGVGITAMIDEARYVALLCGIDDCIRLERHKVVVLVFITCVFFGASVKLARVYHLANVLDDEISAENHKRIRDDEV